MFKIDNDTVLRGGYGMFWAPWNYSAVTSTGYSQTTTMVQNNNIPITSIDNPFPSGLLQPMRTGPGQYPEAAVGVLPVEFGRYVRLFGRRVDVTSGKPHMRGIVPSHQSPPDLAA